MTWFFRILFAINCVAALVAVAFLFIGLADGSVSSFNAGIWTALVGGIAAILIGGWLLNKNGQRGAAIALSLILAAPAALYGLFVVMIVVLQPDFR